MFARHLVSSNQMVGCSLFLASFLLSLVPVEAQQLDPGVCAGCISPAPTGDVLSGAILTPGSITKCSYVNNLGLEFQCYYVRAYPFDLTSYSQSPTNGFLDGVSGNPLSCPTSCKCAIGYTTGPIGGCVPLCTAGHYMRNDGTCTTCTAGTFSSGGAVTSCTQCDANTFSGDGASSCTPCGGTSTSDPRGRSDVVHACDANYYSGSKSSSCTVCPDGSVSPAGSPSCTFNCLAGQFVNDNACTTCPAGTKSNGGAVTACNSCGSNEISSADHSSCVSCPAGSSPNDVHSACIFDCPAGQFVQDNACTTCPAGTKSNGGAVTACNSCGSNEVSSADHSSCLSCPAGSSPNDVHSACIFNCPAGQFVNDNACTTCPVGSKSSGGAVTACNSCGSNEVSSADHSSCLSCPAGSSPDAAHSTCIFICPAGQFVQNNACTPCSAGTKSSGGPVTSCEQCFANTFSAAGASDCTPCPGSQTSDPGSSSCNQHCAAGQYLKVGSCNSCTAGTYSGADASTCSTCPANTFSAPGASSCTACPNASTSNPGSASCSQHCPAGKFIDGTLCTSCAAGTYSGADATTCSTCPVNTFSAAGASSCTACPSGGTCKAGSTHSSQCAPPACPAGKYLDYGRCKTCPRGTFSSKPDSLYCEDCPVDTYSDSGATHCTNCDTGYGCEARSAPGQCKRKPGCPPGQALSNRVCNNCPRNTYSIGGHSPCIVCPKGYSAPRGSSSCTAHPTPSHYPRAQEVLTCPRDHMLCPVYGSTSLECIDVRNSLESCGGCVEVGTNSVGQDCSAIKNVVDVRCNHGRCEVSKCRANFEVSVTHDSCVVPRTARRPRTK